jgi:hypothetical protein
MKGDPQRCEKPGGVRRRGGNWGARTTKETNQSLRAV